MNAESITLLGGFDGVSRSTTLNIELKVLSGDTYFCFVFIFISYRLLKWQLL